MPLLKGKKNMGKNIKTEMEAGKPQKQAVAIAYSVLKRRKKMAKGGEVRETVFDGKLDNDEKEEQGLEPVQRFAKGGTVFDGKLDNDEEEQKGLEPIQRFSEGGEADMKENYDDEDIVTRAMRKMKKKHK